MIFHSRVPPFSDETNLSLKVGVTCPIFDFGSLILGVETEKVIKRKVETCTKEFQSK